MDRKSYTIAGFVIVLICLLLIIIFLRCFIKIETKTPQKNKEKYLLTESIEIQSEKAYLSWQAKYHKSIKWYNVCCFYKCENSLCELCSIDSKIHCTMLRKKKDTINCKIPKKKQWIKENTKIKCSVDYF